MKNALLNSISNRLKNDKDAIFLTADLGFMLLEELQENFPDQFFNVGISEANMIGIAGGLARTGKSVICYSMSPFVTLRCLEQVRMHLSIGQQDITLIGVGAGYAYGPQGCSHHSVEDLGVMLSMAGINIYSIMSPSDLERTVKHQAKYKKPSYIRIGRSEPFALKNSNSKIIEIDLILTNKSTQNDHIQVFTTGSMTNYATKAFESISSELNSKLSIYNITQLKPFPTECLLKAIGENSKILTLEQNILNGGLSSLIANQVLQNQLKIKSFNSLNLPDEFIKKAGSEKDLMRLAAIDELSIAKKIREIDNE